METSGISEKIANNMIDKKVRNNVDNALKYMKQNNINVISVFDDDYPQMLKEIYAPPICLYIKGNLQLLKMQNISLIGCRKCSQYGKKTAYYFSYNLSKAGFNIVSGLARGIDSYSHI